VRPRPAWLAPAATAAALALLVAWSAWHRWVFLTESPYPLGIDGYYYAIQLRSLVEDATLHYPASPLAFWLLAPFAWATDPITGAKLGAAVLGAAVALPAFAAGRRLGGSGAAGLLAAALATSSAGSFYLSIEFVKNGIGLTVAMTYLWLLLRALESPGRGRIAAAALVLVAAALTHKMAVAIAVIVTLPAVGVELHARGRGVRAYAAAAGLVAAAGLALAGRGVGLDLDRLSLAALELGPRTLWMGHEAAIGGGLAVALIAALALRRFAPPAWREAHAVRPSALAAAAGLAALSLVIALPFLDIRDPQGLAFRLRVAAFAPMALVAAALAGAAASALRAEVRALPLLALGAIVVIVAAGRRDEGVVRTHPAMATAVRALAGEVPDGAVVICPERHILFMAAWYARAEVRLRPEPVPAARRWRLMPLAFIGKGSPLDQALTAARAIPTLEPPRGLHPRHPNGLVLVSETTWEWALDQLPDEAAARYRRWKTI
jgi:hypothetical protein